MSVIYDPILGKLVDSIALDTTTEVNGIIILGTTTEIISQASGSDPSAKWFVTVSRGSFASIFEVSASNLPSGLDFSISNVLHFDVDINVEVEYVTGIAGSWLDPYGLKITNNEVTQVEIDIIRLS